MWRSGAWMTSSLIRSFHDRGLARITVACKAAGTRTVARLNTRWIISFHGPTHGDASVGPGYGERGHSATRGPKWKGTWNHLHILQETDETFGRAAAPLCGFASFKKGSRLSSYPVVVPKALASGSQHRCRRWSAPHRQNHNPTTNPAQGALSAPLGRGLEVGLQ
jgi:hypothetical protein